jgi:hypothetical protein
MVFLLFRVEQIPEGMSQRRHGHRASEKENNGWGPTNAPLQHFWGQRLFSFGRRPPVASDTDHHSDICSATHEKERKSVMTP